jgi:hypothetical protein
VPEARQRATQVEDADVLPHALHRVGATATVVKN